MSNPNRDKSFSDAYRDWRMARLKNPWIMYDEIDYANNNDSYVDYTYIDGRLSSKISNGNWVHIDDTNTTSIQEPIKKNNSIGKYISIEKMLFGDYRVQVWDENGNSMLDKEYFCRGYSSAFQTAISVKMEMEQFKDLPIYYYDGNSTNPKKIYD